MVRAFWPNYKIKNERAAPSAKRSNKDCSRDHTLDISEKCYKRELTELRLLPSCDIGEPILALVRKACDRSVDSEASHLLGIILHYLSIETFRLVGRRYFILAAAAAVNRGVVRSHLMDTASSRILSVMAQSITAAWFDTAEYLN